MDEFETLMDDVEGELTEVESTLDEVESILSDVETMLGENKLGEHDQHLRRTTADPQGQGPAAAD